MHFDELIDRRGTHSMKWDMLESLYGVSADTGIAMWVADMDFKPPQAVTDALQRQVEHGIYGYFGDEQAHKAAVIQWMQEQHQWPVKPEWIMSTHGLVAALALCVQAFTQPSEGIILFTPVYHAFAKIIQANQRTVVESPLVNRDGRYYMDLSALEAQLTGQEKMLVFCSPHNPGGRIWSVQEQQALATFCQKHQLILIADEIHHDLVYPDQQHTVTPRAVDSPDTLAERLVMLTATTKTFNIAGGLTGNVIIEDPSLRQRFVQAQAASGTSPNLFGTLMATAAYQHGKPWLTALMHYLDENRRLFDTAVNALPGLRSMPLEATYLAWVDFSDTGLSPSEMIHKVQNEAGIACNHGATFGQGGEYFLRFNIACPRSRVEEALQRLASIFK